MAENTTVNKVVINNETVIDITDTTATPESVEQGQVFYKASGERATGSRTFVTGVKGDSETDYRTGDVNLTKGNLGLSNVENKSSETIRSELTKSNVTTALGFTPYTQAEVDALVSAVFHYKGTKATYAEVEALTGMKVGDVWQVTADNSEYVYNGSSWEKLGPTIDLSGYLTNVSVAGHTLTPSSNTITAAQLQTAIGLRSGAYCPIVVQGSIWDDSNPNSATLLQVNGAGITELGWRIDFHADKNATYDHDVALQVTTGGATAAGTLTILASNVVMTKINGVTVGSSPKFTDTTALSSMTGTLGINHGGTGAATREDARSNLGVCFKAGTYAINGIYAAYITGSGNYLIFFIPCQINTSLTITHTRMSFDSVSIFTQNGAYSVSDIDTSYIAVNGTNNFGLRIELKFKSTKTANVPASILLQGSITFS